MFSDLPTVISTDIKKESTICVTSLNISWNVSNSTRCGDVSYEISIFPPPVGRDPVIKTNDTSLNVTGLNYSLPDVTITVTAINRAGRGNGSTFSEPLPRSMGKCCYTCI